VRRPDRPTLLGPALLLAGAVLAGVMALATDHHTGVPQPQAPGPAFVPSVELGAPSSRRYAEGPAGAVAPLSLLQATQRDPAHGSSLFLVQDGPVVPPGTPPSLGVAALLLGLGTILPRDAVPRRFGPVPRRIAGGLVAAGAGVLGATTVVVGLSGGGVVPLVAACALVVAGGLLVRRRDAGAGWRA
jgi:hypothetical protein